MVRAKGGLFEQAWLAGLARVGRTRCGETRAGAGLGRAGDALDLRRGFRIDSADVHLAHGRALLANGRAAEALEPLRQSYGFWLGHDPKSVWAAEAEYWFGQA